MTKCGLFVGLITLDLVYLVQQIPENNQKIVALDHTIAAGGPATNAAVTFSYLRKSLNDESQCATVLGSLGNHPLSQLIVADLQPHEVTITDLTPAQPQPPPVSSIIVTQTTGERAVISINAIRSQPDINSIPNEALEEIAIVLIDGHQMKAGEAIARYAKSNHIPVAVDGGSWKPGFENVLQLADYAICSTNFYPPGCQTSADVFNYLQTLGVSHIAITQGENPILYLSPTDGGSLPVPQVHAVDTLGAGDIFHGAFCHFILQSSFPDALTQAAHISAHACQFFGTRSWMQEATAI